MNKTYSIILVLAAAATAQADAVYQVTVTTSPLIGHPAGPFSIGFELADGSGTGTGNNFAAITDFEFGGGSPAGLAFTSGSVSGDLSSSIVLTTGSPASLFVQSFTPGNAFSFILDLSTNVIPGSTPDAFVFSLLDSTITPVPTVPSAPLNPFLQVSIDSQNPTVQTFTSNTQQSPAAGGVPLNLSVSITGPVPSTQISTTASGLVYSRVSQTFSGTVTFQNTGSSTIAGPFQVLFTSLPTAVTLVNATGTFYGNPYLTATGLASLAPGQSATVAVKFRDPSNATISAQPVIYSGTFN